MWRKSLRKASFKGIEFGVLATNDEYALRYAHHKFPNKSQGMIESLGHEDDAISIEGFVLGDDYLLKIDQIKKVCRDETEGDLIHPYFGLIKVICTSLRVNHSSSEGRMAKISFSFIKSGDDLEPKKTINTKAAAFKEVDNSYKTSIDVFNKSLSKNDLKEIILTPEKAILNALERFSVPGHINDAKALLETINRNKDFNIYDALDASKFALTLSSITKSFNSILGKSSFKKLSVKNDNSIGSELVRLVAIIKVAEDALNETPTSFDEALKLKQDTINFIDDELLNDCDADIYDAFVSLKSTVTDDLNERMIRLPKISSYIPEVTKPVFLIAYEIFKDPLKADEIISRNKIIHGGFCEALKPLEVLL